MKRMVTKLVAGTPSVKFYDDVRNTYQQDINYLKEYVDGVGVRNQIQLTADKKNTIFRGYTEPEAGLAKLNDLWYRISAMEIAKCSSLMGLTGDHLNYRCDICR